MKRLIFIIVFGLSLAAHSVTAQQDYCFQNDGLKVHQMASFTVTNNRIEGIFNVGDYSGETSGTNFDFTGTKTGNLLTITFKGGKRPYEVAPQSHQIVWTMRSPRRMTIPMYGKNYNTGKYSTYTAVFGPCRDI